MTVDEGDGGATASPREQVRCLRPSGQAYRRALLVSAPFPVGITVRNVLDEGTSWVVHAVSVGGSLLVIGVLLALFFGVTRVGSGDDELFRRNLFGRTRRIPHRVIASVLLVPCYRRLNAPVTTLLAFLDADGRALLRLDGIHWDSARLRSFASVPGAPVAELDGEVTRGQLRERHPYAINWAERHAVALYWASGIVFVLAVGFAIVAASQGWCRPDGC